MVFDFRRGEISAHDHQLILGAGAGSVSVLAVAPHLVWSE